MNRIFKEYLFNKCILVSERTEALKAEESFPALFSIAKLFDVKIFKGMEYADTDTVEFLSDMLGINVPEPFYRGFPESVRKLTAEGLLFDQLLHYAITYGFGDFSEAGHSVFEEDFNRAAFDEDTNPKSFEIMNKEQSEAKLAEIIEDMLASSRPLNDAQYGVLKAYIEEYGYNVKQCVCKNTAIKLLLDTRQPRYAEFLYLSDVIKVVDILNYQEYSSTNIKKLNLKNKDRVFITALIETIFSSGKCDIRECFEKKAIWCGLLHHIHFKSKNPDAVEFTALMRTKGNRSVYSAFEKAMRERDIKAAVTALHKGKGAGAVMRSLNYILSRCETEEDVELVINSAQTDNAMLLAQLLVQYASYKTDGRRAFRFHRYNKIRTHIESDEEMEKRRSRLSPETASRFYEIIRQRLSQVLKGRAGKVYIDKNMYNVAVPIQESTSQAGFGVLPKGTRIPLDTTKKIRAFTYWEKVNDIDLSVIGLTEDGVQLEYSWRSMFAKQDEELLFSGDQTSGYYGGSEYFDLNAELYKKNNPDIRYLIFCDNVYSGMNFNECTCRAGYMLRDINDTGEVFEPATVKSSFTVNCDSRFAYMFGIDLKENMFVWLNMAKDSLVNVAGMSSFEFLTDYFGITSVINVGSLFEMLADEITDDINEAETVVSDEVLELAEGVAQIHSYDFEKITSFLN